MGRGKDYYKKFPPTYQTSEATVFNITSHEVKDAERYQDIRQREQRQWEAKCETQLGREEAAKVLQTAAADTEMGRKVNRIAYDRWGKIQERGFDIVSNNDFDKHGAPPAPYTRPAPSLQAHFLNENREASASFTRTTFSPSLSVGQGTGTSTRNEAGPEASMRRQFTPNGAKDTSTGHDTGRKLVPTSSMPGDLAAYHHSSASLSPAARDRGRDLAGGNMTTYDFYSTNRPPNNYPAAVTGLGGPGVAVPAKHAPFHANPRARPHSQSSRSGLVRGRLAPPESSRANELGHTTLPAPPSERTRSPDSVRDSEGGSRGASSFANSRVRTGGFNKTPR